MGIKGVSMPDMNENAETQQEYFGITTQDDLKGCYYNRCKFCGYRPTCEMQKELVRKENEIKKLEEEKKLAREQEDA